ncbi:phosphodiester glycosidase family protein [Romeria aff. gracilis LEGE 07310]|uniref:Phosphodiester glycosidase family protein n=1 Tax=Vasconcelosia minhoensis LEGE 07310 TaxID=915328 RepID=A0A8J7A6R9_9CYAN|nr:phosphodiester glycosidase family protein [Romeria gracilis]MBE9077822.1 phosphodiester glycosidase family protein [Romeria aff. gracilis LEGE 07310]
MKAFSRSVGFTDGQSRSRAPHPSLQRILLRFSRISLLAAVTWVLPGGALSPAELVASKSGLVDLESLTQQQTAAQADQTQAQLSPGVPQGASQGGTQISFNGRTLSGRWQRQDDRISLTSAAASLLGAELTSSSDPARQPLDWFPRPETARLALPVRWQANERYLDITDWAQSYGWQLQTRGNQLQITQPPGQVGAIRQGRQPWGDRIVIDLSQPAAWQVDAVDGYTVTLDALTPAQTIAAFKPSLGNLLTGLKVSSQNGRTVINLKTSDTAQPRIWTLGNPNRLVIDIRQDAMVERDIAWAPGVRWRQQYVTVGGSRFPVYLLVVDPRESRLDLRPIWSNPGTAVGIAPIITTAQRYQAAAAVNAGFFNRNNQLPLGALRENGRWISGPILGRGAMAWNPDGDLVMDRLRLSEVVTTESGQTFPVLTVNSGYVQAGIARFTSDWGASYTPITDGEVVITVRDQRVADQRTLGSAGSGSIPIPPNGYLLVLRNFSTAAASLRPGSGVAIASQSLPTSFDQYANVVGGGPLLIRDRRVVLDPQLEGFSSNFIQGMAPRTAIGKTADGTWLIVAMQGRIGGRGPTLAETAQIMQQLGSVDALNLDGGSSSSLYLGGQLLNRSPRTAARVHNGIGLFLTE